MKPSRVAATTCCLAAIFCAQAACTLDTTGGLEADGPVDASVDHGGRQDASLHDGAAGDAQAPDADVSVGSDAAKDTGAGTDGPTEAMPCDAVCDAPGPDVGEAGEAGCVSETDPELCEKHGKNCGIVVATDVCGDQRTVDCGGCAGVETCGGGGVPNVCGSWWSCGWSRRSTLEVHATAAVAQGYSVKLVLDHAMLVSQGLSRADGADVRVVRREGAQWIELDRVLDPVSSWGQATTTVWFGLRGWVGAGAVDAEYFLYFGNPSAGPAPSDEGKVFHFADLFDRADATTLGNGWTVMEESATKVNVTGGAMVFETTADVSNRPVVEHGFAPIDAGMSLRLGFRWARTGDEGTYRVHMQLGDSASMDNPPPVQDMWSINGVGPSLLWAGLNQGMTSHEGFGYAVGPTVHQVATATGATDIEARVSVPYHAFGLIVGPVQAVGLPFSGGPTVLDRVRIFTWQVNQAYFGSRAFDYVIVRNLVDPEPSVERKGETVSSCQ